MNSFRCNSNIQNLLTILLIGFITAGVASNYKLAVVDVKNDSNIELCAAEDSCTSDLDIVASQHQPLITRTINQYFLFGKVVYPFEQFKCFLEARAPPV
ncbi:hypothetical protein [Spartinivicinus ruber]|uniref:hypothetical protein n=1 Tax=Spartinivicinus ruber TaxID=2683272 RepID=UPI0013D77157|nr:hypothetical protein [Spartinivicinus ruber]